MLYICLLYFFISELANIIIIILETAQHVLDAYLYKSDTFQVQVKS